MSRKLERDFDKTLKELDAQISKINGVKPLSTIQLKNYSPKTPVTPSLHSMLVWENRLWKIRNGAAASSLLGRSLVRLNSIEGEEAQNVDVY